MTKIPPASGPRSSHTVSTPPAWFAGVQPFSHPPLGRDAHADVCVVGGGIAGLTAAYRLAVEGRQVIVLDAGAVGDGDSGRTTAHLSWALDDRFHRIIGWRGREVARLAAESHAAAIDAIEALVAEETIACGFRRVPGHLVLPENGKIQDLENELEALRSLDRPGVQWLDSFHFGAHEFGPTLRFGAQAQLHALEYLNGLVMALERHGAQVHHHTRVREVRGEGALEVVTEDDRVVRAAHVVIATNAPIDSPAEIYLKEYAHRTYAIALSLTDGSLPAALLWDDDRPYHYVRRMEPPNGDPMLLVGGEDHPTGAPEEGAPRWDRLEAWARERFADLGERRHQWSGQVFETLDGLALIGPAPGMPEGTFVITGDSGMGMTHGTVGGMLVTDLILGRPSAWAEVYDPSRKPVRAAAELAREVAPHAASYVSKPLEAAFDHDHDVAPGTGKVVYSGREPVALYREPDGRLIRLSGTCTHRGCVLSWNAAERTWDCGCHGSRFDAHGQVLNAPAIEPLHAVEEERRRASG